MERKRILLAVNQPVEFQGLRNLLISAGYEVKIATNGVSASALVPEFKPHLVASELKLPKVDGHHLLRELKGNAATSKIPFVLLSKHRSVEERVHSIELGADDYLTSPFDEDELLTRFEILLQEIAHFEASPTRHARGFSGKLRDMNVVELLQTLEIGEKSAVVKLQGEHQEGELILHKGKLVGVALDDLPPQRAIFRLFTWREGSFRVEFKEAGEHGGIDFDPEKVVPQGLAYRERWDKVMKQVPSTQACVRVERDRIPQEISDDEKVVMSKLNGPGRIHSIIENGQFDDLRMLEIIAGLCRKGILVEAPKELLKNGHIEKSSRHSDSSSDDISRVIATFLGPANGDGDREENHSSRNGTRKKDLPNQSSRVYLNKSELLMIKRKLGASGDKPKTQF